MKCMDFFSGFQDISENFRIFQDATKNFRTFSAHKKIFPNEMILRGKNRRV